MKHSEFSRDLRYLEGWPCMTHIILNIYWGNAHLFVLFDTWKRKTQIHLSKPTEQSCEANRMLPSPKFAFLFSMLSGHLRCILNCIFSYSSEERHASIQTWVYFQFVRIYVLCVFMFLLLFFLMGASLNVQSNAIYFGQLHLSVILHPWNEGCWGIRQHILSYNQVLQCDFLCSKIGYVPISVLSSLFQKWVHGQILFHWCPFTGYRGQIFWDLF